MAKPDKATLAAYIEELGFSDALKANLLQELEADEARATAFVSQRLRQADYTKKTQDLASQRKELDTAVTQQVQEYARKLQEADGKIAKILKDFENEQISRTTAENRLRTLATKYEIPNEDVADLLKDPAAVPQPKQGGESVTLEAVSALMNKTLEDYTKKLMPELVSFPRISAIQQEIRDQHMEIFGKRITQEQMEELMTASGQPNSGGLMKVWADKFEVNRVRGEQHDKSVAEAAVKKYQDEQTRKASEDAIRQVHNQDSTRPLSSSPVLRDYRSRAEDGQPSGTGADKGKPGGEGNKQPEPRMSGAERAAIKWTERRNRGIQLGKDAPAA